MIRWTKSQWRLVKGSDEMDFIPDDQNAVEQIPYFEDVSKATGWAGHTTDKPERDLMSEIAVAVGRLGGIVNRWQRGRFGNRYGYRMFFTLQGGQPGRFDIVGLPLRTEISSRGYETKKDQSIRMALFNLRNQLESIWRMEQLVPGYFGLLPMMLANKNHTFGELWLAQNDAGNLLPASVQDEIVEGEFEEA